MMIAQAQPFVMLAPARHDRAECPVCGSAGLSHGGALCPHEAEPWHEEAEALAFEIRHTASPRLSTMLSLDLEELVARNLDRAH